MVGQNTIVHVVQNGETLESIAKKYKTTVANIKAGNPETMSDIYVGMRLEILVNQYLPYQDDNIAHQNEASSYSERLQSEQVENKNKVFKTDIGGDGFVGGTDYTFMLDPDNKIYGFRANGNDTSIMSGLLGLSFGVEWEARDHGSYSLFLGLGLMPRYVAGPIMIGFHLYPYLNWLFYEEIVDFYNSGKPKYDKNDKVSYGAALDVMAGIKLWTTQKGTQVYLTGSYELVAPEFKTDNTFKKGIWGIGITTIGIF